MASAAIPALFPPVWLEDPEQSQGYYIDGGVRLNAPFDAALAMGIDRVVVISGHSVGTAPIPPQPQRLGPPDLAGTAAVALRAVLADGLTDDLQSLRRKNQRVPQGKAGLSPHRLVPQLVVAPQDGELAELAAAAFRPGPTDPYWSIGRTLDALGSGSGRDELLSLIFFNRTYAERQVALGRQNAKDTLATGWQI